MCLNASSKQNACNKTITYIHVSYRIVYGIQKPKWVKVESKPDKKLELRKRLDDANTNMSNIVQCVYMAYTHMLVGVCVQNPKHRKHLLTSYFHILHVCDKERERECNKQENSRCKIVVVWMLVNSGVLNVFMKKNDACRSGMRDHQKYIHNKYTHTRQMNWTGNERKRAKEKWRTHTHIKMALVHFIFGKCPQKTESACLGLRDRLHIPPSNSKQEKDIKHSLLSLIFGFCF